MRRACWPVLVLLLAGCSSPDPAGPPAPTGFGGTPTAAPPSVFEATRGARSGGEATGQPGTPPQREFTFRFQVGDEVGVSVWKEEELTTIQRILPDGTLAPPLLGTVKAAGLTVDELKGELTEHYRTYLKDPKVSVHVEGIYSDRVFVIGEVKLAQAVPLFGPMTVLQSIAMAEGFEETSAEKSVIRLIRRGPGGRPLVYNVDAEAVLVGRAADPLVQRGDIVFVPARGVTNWARTAGQALAPIATGLGTLGGIAGTTAAVIAASNN